MEQSKRVKILVVDDEEDIRDILTFNLESEGYLIDTASSSEEALKILSDSHSLILLDVMMEGVSGFKMADEIRKKGNNIPIIFLTAKNTQNDMLTGFSIGGDDYIVKPFSIKEVIARIKSVVKRFNIDNKKEENFLIIDSLKVDIISKNIYIDDKKIELTKTEFNILVLLLKNQNRVFTRSEIIDKVWDNNSLVLDRTVDVHIARLRKKIDKYAEHLINKNRYGYIFISSI